MASDSDTLQKDMAALRADIDKLTKDVSSISQSLAKELKTRAGDTVNRVSSGAQSLAEDIGARGARSAEAVENSVRERPFQSLVIAFGAGLLLAQLLRRR